MIALFDGAVPDTAAGCRIAALKRCYEDIDGAVAIYKNDGGNVICRFEDRLISTGDSGTVELCRFADVIGADLIELESEKTVFSPPVGWRQHQHPLLYRDCGGGEEIDFLRSPKQCFDVICAADSGFAAGARYLYWLSDLTRRQNRSCAKAYYSGGAAAVLSAVGERTAYLSQVAVLPDKRRAGLASKLIEQLCSDNMLCDRRLFVAAQNDGLTGFYMKNGFLPLGKSLITLKRSGL